MMTNERPEVLISGSRELREIPAGWQHPRDARGRYIPLLPADYPFEPDEERTPTMPPTDGLAETEIAAYEATSEGTPISPNFPNTTEGRLALVNWCAAHASTFADNRAGAEAWAALLFGDAAVALDGTVRA